MTQNEIIGHNLCSFQPFFLFKMEEALIRELVDPRSPLNVESLLVSHISILSLKTIMPTDCLQIVYFIFLPLQDAVTALVDDCNYPVLRRIKNIDSFVSRCEHLFFPYIFIYFCCCWSENSLLISIHVVFGVSTKCLECRVLSWPCSDEELARKLSDQRLKGSDFQLVKVIGRGSFGEVQLVRHTRTRQVHAMKLLNKYDMVWYIFSWLSGRLQWSMLLLTTR